MNEKQKQTFNQFLLNHFQGEFVHWIHHPDGTVNEYCSMNFYREQTDFLLKFMDENGAAGIREFIKQTPEKQTEIVNILNAEKDNYLACQAIYECLGHRRNDSR